MRKTLTTLLLLLAAIQAGAQVTMRNVFKQIPDTLTSYLTQNSLLDCIDFIDSNMAAEVTNALGGKSRLSVLTDRYAQLQLSDALQIEMLLLDTDAVVDDSRQIVCVIQTFGVDVKESQVSFYTPSWRKLETEKYVTIPSYLFTAQLHPDTSELTLTSVGYFDRPVMEEQKDFVISSTNLKWSGTIFK